MTLLDTTTSATPSGSGSCSPRACTAHRSGRPRGSAARSLSTAMYRAPCAAKARGKAGWPAPDVDDGAGGERLVPADELDGVLGQVGVEALRVGLLDAGRTGRGGPSARGCGTFSSARNAWAHGSQPSRAFCPPPWILEVRCPCVSSCSTGATCTTRRPAARRSTSSRSPKGSPPAATTVTFRTAAYPGALPEETVAGVRYLRRGGHYSIYPRAFGANTTASHDVVVDVQNGVPYLSPLVTRSPVVNLVHHVHREQWPVVFGPRTARFGWWLESRAGARGSTAAPATSPSATPRCASSSSSASTPSGSRSSTTARMPSPTTDAERSPAPRVVVPRPARAAEAGRDRPRRRGGAA